MPYADSDLLKEADDLDLTAANARAIRAFNEQRAARDAAAAAPAQDAAPAQSSIAQMGQRLLAGWGSSDDANASPAPSEATPPTSTIAQLGQRLLSGWGDSPTGPTAASGTPAAMPSARRYLSDGTEIGDVNISQAGTRASRYAGAVARIAAEEGVPADALAALIDTEDSDEQSTSVNGARGLLQVVPGQGFDLPGEDAHDPETSIRQGARALREKLRMTGGDVDEAGAAYFGYGTDGNGMTTSAYRDRYMANRRKYQQAPGRQDVPLTSLSRSAETNRAKQPAGRAEEVSSDQPAGGAFSAGTYTPHQINAATAEGLDYETALAVCGPAAAIAFARKNGRNPTMSEAVSMAREVGWTSAQGMAGPASEQQLLRNMGVAARLQDGAPDWKAVAADVQRGNPVIISTPGHYFVAERYDPESGQFDFGNSVAVLKASGGRRWFRPDELPSLGMGEARASLFMDSPESPSPSVVAGRTSYKVSAEDAPLDQGGPSAGDQKRARLAAQQQQGDDSGLQYRQPINQPTQGDTATGEYVDPEQGPRESGYTVPAEPSTYGGGGDDPGTPPIPSYSPPNSAPMSGQEDQSPAPAPWQVAPPQADPSQPTAQPVPAYQYQPTEYVPPGIEQRSADLDRRAPSRFQRNPVPAGETEAALPFGPAVPTAGSVATDLGLEPDPARAAISQVPGQRPTTPPPSRFQQAQEAAPYQDDQSEPAPSLPTLPGEAGRTLTEEVKRSQRSQNQTISPLAIYAALQAVPFDVYARARQELISDAEAGRMSGTDPLAPFRGLGIPLPSAEEINPEGRPASDVAAGLLIAGALPDPADPLVAQAFRAAGRAVSGGRRVVQAAGRALRPAEEGAEAVARELPTIPGRTTEHGSQLAALTPSQQREAIDNLATAAEEQGVISPQRAAEIRDATARGFAESQAREAAAPTGEVVSARSERIDAESPNSAQSNARQMGQRALPPPSEEAGSIAREAPNDAQSGAQSNTRQVARAGETPQSATRQRPPESEAIAREGETIPAEQPTKYEYSSTQLDLPDPVARDVRKASARIADADLAPDGRDAEPHTTVFYGLEAADPEQVRPIIERHAPITVRLGKTSVFPDDGVRGSDVVKVDVDSPALHSLNAELAQLPNGNKYPEFQPHVTLGYVKPGRGRKYAGSTALAGREATIDSVTFSSKDGEKTTIPLLGRAADEAPSTEPPTAQAPSTTSANARSNEPNARAAPSTSSEQTAGEGVVSLHGAGTGAALGAASGDEDESDTERAERAAVGALLGMVTGGRGRGRGKEPPRGIRRSAPTVEGEPPRGQRALPRPGVRSADDLIFDAHKAVGVPEKAPTLDPGKLERWRRNFVRAVTDNRVDLAELQNEAQRLLGRRLTGEEMVYEASRANPSGAAKVAIDQHVRPILTGLDSKKPVVTVTNSRGESAGMTEVQVLSRMLELVNNRDTALALSAPARKFPGGLSGEESEIAARALLDKLPRETQIRVGQAANAIGDVVDRYRERLVDAGVWSRELGDQLKEKYPYWTPTRVLDYMRDQGQPGAATMRTISLSDRHLRQYTFEGTSKMREDGVASLIRYIQQAEEDIAKNRTFNAFYNLREGIPEWQGLIREVKADTPVESLKGEKAVTGWVNGERKRLIVPAPMATAIQMEQASRVPLVGVVTRGFRELVTRTPAFIAGQVPLDAGSFIIREVAREGGPTPQNIARVSAALVAGYGEAFRGLFDGTYHGDTARYLSAGGGMAGYYERSAQAASHALDDVSRRSMLQIRNRSDLAKTAKWLALQGPTVAVGERVELAPRTASFRLGRERAIRRGVAEPIDSTAMVVSDQAGATPNQPERTATGVDERAADLTAMTGARDVTLDFQRGGTWSMILNQVVPFLNVGIQSAVTPWRSFREKPKAYAATVMGLIGGPMLAVEAWNRADEQRAKDYDDVPGYIKDRGMVIMTGTSWTDESGERRPRYVMLPTRELSPFVIFGRELAGRTMGALGVGKEIEPRAWSDLLWGSLSAASPVQASGPADLFSSLNPVGINTGAQLSYDYDTFRNRRIATERGDREAGVVAHAISDTTGVGRPSQVEFAMRDVGGNLGAAVLAGADLGASLMGAVPKDAAPRSLESTPVLGSVTKRWVGDATGGRLDRAQRAMISPEIKKVITSAGLRVDQITGVDSKGPNDFPFTRAEQGDAQRLMNERMSDPRTGVAGLPRQISNWDRLSKEAKESVIRERVLAARQYAEGTVFSKITSQEKQRRFRNVQAQKAS